MRDTTADLSGPDDPTTGTPDPVASSRYTLYLGSNLTDLATASTTVDLAQLHVFELTAGHILAEICQAPGFVEAPILGFLSSRGFCPGLVDPFGMDLDGRSVVNR